MQDNYREASMKSITINMLMIKFICTDCLCRKKKFCISYSYLDRRGYQ